ncbi:MAG: hypothetical protein IJ546_05015 [Prevotella sp.]|nr:hypothetical protein [Prevotella sp.]MBR1840320.1 hypothetical protein [Prevotella sp.]
MDKTSAVAAWSGGNYTSATDGIALIENYVTNTTSTGNIFEQTVSGLDQGYYKVTLYANAIYTPERGFSSDASDFDSDRVFIFATGNGTTKKTAVPIKYGIITTGSETFTVNAYVGSDGNLTIGMVKEKVGTNWHSIATKSLVYYGNDLTAIKAELNTEISTANALSIAATETETFSAAIAMAQNVYDSSTATFDEVDAAITTLKIAEKYAQGGFSSATLNNPVLTSFVVNGDFTSFTDNWPDDGWYTTAGVGNHGQMTEGDEKAWENYSWGNEKLSGKMYFRMTDIPNGAYSVSIDGFSRTASSTYVYANKERVYLSANETYETKVIPVIVKNNILEVGEYSGKIDWMKIKKVSVSYTGDPLASYKNTIKSLIETGEGLDITGIPSSVSEAMSNDINTYKNVYNTYTEEEQCTAAVAALQTSVQKAQAYVAAKAVVDKMNTLIENNNLYTTSAYDTFCAYITKFNNAEYTTEEANALNGVVFGTGWRSTAAVDDFLISAWDVTPRDWDSYHVNTWSTINDSGNPNLVVPCIEYWIGDQETLADKVMTATLNGFTAGAEYKVTATVCLGVNTGVDASTVPTGISLQLNDGDATSVCTGSRINETRFYEGTFEAKGMIGVDGKLNVKFNVASTNVSWMTFRNVKYVKISDAAVPTQEDLDNLDTAIGTAEAKTLGFETGEYAPYENVEALEALATAKGVKDNQSNSKLSVTWATSALNGATWTPNSEEVNAIGGGNLMSHFEYNGTYDIPNGWSNTGYNTRIVGNNESPASDNPGLKGTTNNRALLVKYSTSYGDVNGYTLPLEANTTYKFSFVYGLWNEDGQITKGLTMTAPDNSTIEMTPSTVSKNDGGKDNCANNVDTAWATYEAFFTTTTKGNYKLNIVNTDGNHQRQMVFADFVLKKAVVENVTIAEDVDYTPVAKYANVTFNRTLVEGWNGLVLPFDMTIDDAKTTFSATAVKDLGSVTSSADGATLNFVDATEIKAGRPFMLKAAAGTSYTINNVILSADALQTVPKAAEGNAAVYTFTGTYAGTTDLTDVTFFLINGTKYYYHTAGVNSSSAKAFRAYFVNETPTAQNSRVSFNFGDDTTTGIESLSSKKMVGEIYNLNGQKVEKAQKGLYIVNGKKVVVK